MKDLEFPFDADALLSKRKRLKRELLAMETSRVKKKVAVLGGFTTHDIRQMLELFLLNYGVEPEFYESEYAKFYEDAMFGTPELDGFQPDFIYICTSNRNVIRYPQLSDSAEQVDALLDETAEKFRSVWEALFQKFHCPVIQNNFEMPYVRLLGNRDAWDIHGAVNFLTRLNGRFYEYARTHDNFYICDINYLSADYGLTKWSDPFYWHMYKYAVAVPAIPYLSFSVANIVKSLLGKNKKGFVLDLDNTLWGGVIGDDGVDNIVLGQETAEAQSYSAFQQYLKAHKQLGIILNIDSKNDRENALAGLRHPDSTLEEKDFIVIKANWEPKDRNFTELAQELSLLPESLVFVDDNPAERHIVTGQLPGVAAPELTDVSHYPWIIDRSGFFEVTNLSADDLRRNEMYQVNAMRTRLEKSFSDYGDYLRSLEMRAQIRPFESVYMARIAQLTNKTNQFNLTTKRFTQAEIEQAAEDPGCITLYGRLEDRFGDNGVVSVVLGKVRDGCCDIVLWLMSCRVLKRDLEDAMMDELAGRCIARGVQKLVGYYYPTEKNHMVEHFYEQQGFEKVSESPEGGTVWELELSRGYEAHNRYIKIITEGSL